MPRPRKSTNTDQENQGSQDLTSKSSRRKRTPSAEMAGMTKSSKTGTTGKRTVGRPRKSKTENEHEYESPDKRRGYEHELIDDYYQEGARYARPSERGRTEFEYDRRHQQPRDPYWGAPQEYSRQSYYDPGITSDYRNRRGGSSDYSSDYLRDRGDVPSGGYYGYKRMQERSGEYNYGENPRYSDQRNDWNRRSEQPYYGSSRQEDMYYGTSRGNAAYGGAWHSDYDEAPQSYRDEQNFDRRRRYSDEQSEYRTGETGRRGYSMYDDRSQQRPEYRERDSWQNWDPEEREMMNRREGGYPKNISRRH